MAKRRKLVVGNWKMNGRLTSGLTLAKDLADKALAERPLSYDLVICPPASLLWPVAETIMGSPVLLGAQDCHRANHGAYTGDISAGMLADLGCRYVILGHSERRNGHGETGAEVAAKVTAGHLAGLTTIVCVGETQDQRMSGKTEEVITEQITSSLPDKYQVSSLVIAYEPVWAIGSGEQPEVGVVRQVNKLIRKVLGSVGEVVQVLYGGSVAPQNAESLFAEPEIDGVLVGAASLNSDGFWAIAEKARLY
ncbi:MAG: triose-phosphate isomerase [Alphaproteobacteria bacterium]|nr:triose-phosphate isomerase [Alphaproteobacteria bacterium]